MTLSAKGDERWGGERPTPEQIIVKLREAEIELPKGLTTGNVFRRLGIADPRDFGRLSLSLGRG